MHPEDGRIYPPEQEEDDWGHSPRTEWELDWVAPLHANADYVGMTSDVTTPSIIMNSFLHG
jgi:hypothetical protein